MAEERKISPAVVIIPVALGLAVAAVIGIAAMAKAAPPVGYTCPYCGANFATYEELVEHIQNMHPGWEVPVLWGYSDVRCWRAPGIFNYLGVEIYQTVGFSALITNPGAVTTMKTVQLFWKRLDVPGGTPMPSYAISLTLAPGQRYTFTNPTGEDPNAIYIIPGMTFELWLVDSDGRESARVQYTARA